jgi:16S rRNA A1518/A1519 N6-dimethyltransferase RsmA/KsgA/DIM1 with predicted DNA glycosylase/AP lyase activity
MKRRRLGQHYLVDRTVVRRIVSLAGIRPTERVLEVGTGKGVLTKELVGLGASYLGYEVDRRNFEETKKMVHGPAARLALGDAFDQRAEFDVLVSSLPYSESTRFVRWLTGIDFGRAVVVLQDDFVRKIMAPPGARDYRGISALSQLCFEIRVIDEVKRESFVPRPKVESVIASFLPKLRITRSEASDIFRLFALRRRRVDSAIAELGMKRDRSFGERRVYSLRPEEVHRLCLRQPQ